MTAETSNERGDVVAERQAWYEQQIALAEGQWAADFLDRWECGDDVPSKEHYVALWLAERAAPQPAAAQQQGQGSGGEVIQRHVVTKYRDGRVHVADVASAECPHDWGQDEAHGDWARCYKCGISRRKPLAQQPVAEEQLTYKGVPIGPMQTFADMERQAIAPVGAAEDIVLDAIERRESSAPVGVEAKTLPVPTRVHLIGETAVIVGTPERGWDEDAQDAHNCDDMGCSTIGPHVLARVPFTDERALSQQPEALAKHQPCGCVLCTCEDEKQCQGCGAKFCGNRTDHPAYVKQQPEARGGGEVVAWMTPGGDVSKSFYWCLERCLPGQEEPQPLYAAPPSAPVGVEAFESRMRGRAGPFTAQPGERYVDADIALAVLREALAQQPAPSAPDRPKVGLVRAGDGTYYAFEKGQSEQPAAVDEARGVVDVYTMQTIADAAAALDKRGDRQMAARLIRLHARLLATKHQEPKS